MNNTPQDGGPAFPVRDEDGAGGYIQHNGMTLRDHFAAAALQGILSDPASDGDSESFAVHAYTMADAMLAARKEGSK